MCSLAGGAILTCIPTFCSLMERHFVNNFGKDEHGERTLNPGVPQPGLFPVVMSLKPLTPFLYRKGFRKPSDGCPLARRASFRRATKPANAGEEADVPPINTGRPERMIRKRLDCAATSGMAYTTSLSAGKVLHWAWMLTRPALFAVDISVN